MLPPVPCMHRGSLCLQAPPGLQIALQQLAFIFAHEPGES